MGKKGNRDMEIKERLLQLRNKMKERKLDGYVIPTADFHDSEYAGPYFKCREYVTGFTGSAGIALIMAEEACLWTDGRYFVQAGQELEGSGIRLMKTGEEGVLSLEEYIEERFPNQGILGFDGRVMNTEQGLGLEQVVKKKGGVISCDIDLAGEIWSERPNLSAQPIWILEERYAGKSGKEKLDWLGSVMDQEGASVFLVTALDEIAWLLNIRGNDVPCNPVALSYFVREQKNGHERNLLFIQEQAAGKEVQAYLEQIGVELAPYETIYEYVKGFQRERILLEKKRINMALWKNLDSSNHVVDKISPCAMEKAIKNPIEMENIRKAHIKDGVAVTKFLYWLKTNIGTIPMDEISVADRLEAFRKEQEGYLEPSFETISAYGANAAMCHYSATEEKNTKLEAKGFYLVDSGGQYYEGTTDITRTVVLGPITAEERLHFTLTVMGMLRLGNAKFRYGCSGINLDQLAREPFWQRGLDFNHGTGHGVGYLLNVHEGPNSIRWKPGNGAVSWIFQEGMLTSDEPGIYMEGSHGIRTENLMLCRKGEKNEYGQFMEFEFVTFVPIDLDGIDVSVMEETDIRLLNVYHQNVWETISPYLDGEEKEWLRQYTRPVEKSENDLQRNLEKAQ